jgi:hypothetical protein
MCSRPCWACRRARCSGLRSSSRLARGARGLTAAPRARRSPSGSAAVLPGCTDVARPDSTSSSAPAPAAPSTSPEAPATASRSPRCFGPPPRASARGAGLGGSEVGPGRALGRAARISSDHHGRACRSAIMIYGRKVIAPRWSEPRSYGAELRARALPAEPPGSSRRRYECRIRVSPTAPAAVSGRCSGILRVRGGDE